MTASPHLRIVLDVRQAITRYLAEHAQVHAARVLGVDPSAVSRAITDAYDGRLDHAARWSAAQFAAMQVDDASVLGAVVAAAHRGDRAAGDPADILAVVSRLLATAQEATQAISVLSPGGVRLTDAERRHLLGTYRTTLAQLARAVAALDPEAS